MTAVEPAQITLRVVVPASTAPITATVRPPKLTPTIAHLRRLLRLDLERMLPPAASLSAPSPALVLVALSGGADSLALAVSAAAAGSRLGVRVGAVVVDHQLQQRSAEVAETAAQQARALGLAPVVVCTVSVVGAGGPEAAARAARYAALDHCAEQFAASAVFLAHTADDQAESVLLGLARGAGAASLAGMAPVQGSYRRPFLSVTREQTVQCCADSGLIPWQDPHNSDPRYARVRVRQRVLPLCESELGPGIREALVRTAQQLREDEDALQLLVDQLLPSVSLLTEGEVSLSAKDLAGLSAAVRQRIVRRIVLAEFGVSLSRLHTVEVCDLALRWHGQGPLSLPGIRVSRRADRIIFERNTVPTDFTADSLHSVYGTSPNNPS